MNFNSIQDNVPESKSRVLTEPDHTERHKQSTEDGPDKIEKKKISPFRKLLNNLWGPIQN